MIVDWETGRTLQLSGVAEILWDGPEVERRPKADRVIAIEVHAVADQVRALPIRFELRQPYPLQPPLPGERRPERRSAVAVAAGAVEHDLVLGHVQVDPL